MAAGILSLFVLVLTLTVVLTEASISANGEIAAKSLEELGPDAASLHSADFVDLIKRSNSGRQKRWYSCGGYSHGGCSLVCGAQYGRNSYFRCFSNVCRCYRYYYTYG